MTIIVRLLILVGFSILSLGCWSNDALVSRPIDKKEAIILAIDHVLEVNSSKQSTIKFSVEVTELDMDWDVYLEMIPLEPGNNSRVLISKRDGKIELIFSH